MTPRPRFSLTLALCAAALMWGTPSALQAQGLDAQMLLEVAAARADAGGEAASDSVTTLLTRIETEHPDTDLGLQVTLMRARGMGDMEILAALRSMTQPETPTPPTPPAPAPSAPAPVGNVAPPAPAPTIAIQAATEADEQALGLTREDRREIQGRLTSLGYNTRGVDGVFGPGSRGAITQWQQAMGIAGTGFLNRQQFTLLREETSESYPDWVEDQQARAARAPSSRTPAGFRHPRRTTQQMFNDARACGANVVLLTIVIPQGRTGSVVACMQRRGYTPYYR